VYVGVVSVSLCARQYLRVFQSGGSQGSILCLPGPVVAMTGEGPLLAVVYHRSPPVGLQQLLGYTVYRVPSNGVAVAMAQGDVPMLPEGSLAWLGYSTTNVRRRRQWLPSSPCRGFFLHA
jgi:hypothetical protein